MLIDAGQAAELLLAQERVRILAHQNPDGDTLGCSFALWNVLHSLGRKALVECPSGFPERFSFLYEGYTPDEFDGGFLAALDVASPHMIREEYRNAPVDLCIDHHSSNAGYASQLCLEPDAAATCQLLLEVIRRMNAEITPRIATCLYTGLATDTGCFRFSNTSAATLRCAAELLELGAAQADVNERLFETTTRELLQLEQQVMAGLRYFGKGRIALITITQQMLRETGVSEPEMDGISNLPKRIQGVEIGVTLREKPEGGLRVSLRTRRTVDAAQICGAFGGGGHLRAAGCTLREEEVQRLIALCESALPAGEERP